MTCSLRRFCARLALLGALIGAMASCSALGLDGGTSARSRLERQKAKWVQQHLASYTYSVACVCFGILGPVQVEVRDNLVAAASDRFGEPVSLFVQNELPTSMSYSGSSRRPSATGPTCWTWTMIQAWDTRHGSPSIIRSTGWTMSFGIRPGA
jgi:hypothetical protein